MKSNYGNFNHSCCPLFTFDEIFFQISNNFSMMFIIFCKIPWFFHDSHPGQHIFPCFQTDLSEVSLTKIRNKKPEGFMQSCKYLVKQKSHISFGAKSRETLWDFLKQTCLTRCLNQTFPICLRPIHLQHLFKHQISWNIIPKSCDHHFNQSNHSKFPNLVRKCETLWKNISI